MRLSKDPEERVGANSQADGGEGVTRHTSIPLRAAQRGMAQGPSPSTHHSGCQPQPQTHV